MEEELPRNSQKCRSSVFRIALLVISYSRLIQPILSLAERNLYAALISDLPSVLPACETWEDHLWAYVQSRMEDRIEQRCSELGGFWEGEGCFSERSREEKAEAVRGGLEEVFASIRSVQKEEVQ